MEVQIPLVIFTSFMAWAAGIFGTQCILALRKQGARIQMPTLITAFVVLVIGGVAVMFHLARPLNIFNGFGHLTSGITQELIAVALLVILMIIYFFVLWRGEKKIVPKPVCIIGLIFCVLLIAAMGDSYMMASRPAWNSVLQLLSLLGAACVLGPASVAVIAAIRKEHLDCLNVLVPIGACINVVLSAAYLIYVQLSSSAFESFEYYFDPTHPNNSLVTSSNISLASQECLAATIITIVMLVVTCVMSFFVRRLPEKWQVAWNSGIVLFGLVGAFALRIAMYIMGETVFMLY